MYGLIITDNHILHGSSPLQTHLPAPGLPLPLFTQIFSPFLSPAFPLFQPCPIDLPLVTLYTVYVILDHFIRSYVCSLSALTVTFPSFVLLPVSPLSQFSPLLLSWPHVFPSHLPFFFSLSQSSARPSYLFVCSNPFTSVSVSSCLHSM